MTNPPTRRPSTLSVSRAQAAARPLGASMIERPASNGAVDTRDAARPAPVRSAASSAPRAADRPPADRQSAERSRAEGSRSGVDTERLAIRHSREQRDQRVVATLVSAFVLAAVIMMAVSLTNSARESRAKDQLNVTFAKVHTEQAEYRALFGRFASWPELEARGARVGPRQTVRGWNADASHWFISVRDQATGLICDRTGELFDEDGAERAPVCRGLK